jgi:CBS domain-containing protein
MPIVESHSMLSGIPVAKAMRRQVITLAGTASIGQGIRMMIRHRVNAVLIIDHSTPFGVVSKTDLLGAYYAQLPMETALQDVMGSQPIACFADDPLEDALEIMEAAGVHRLFIIGANREQVIGIVAYSDIVGLLYRYCRACERGLAKRRAKHSEIDSTRRFSVRDVMTPDVQACLVSDPISMVIETLSSNRIGAALIQNEDRCPAGVISKTDLIIAYHHGIAPETESGGIMKSPVHSIAADELLHTAIQQMLIREVQRLFVHADALTPDKIIGVLTLSDSARSRSGSCRACTAGRMLNRF